MPIRIDGTLLLKKIVGRNGPFCVGELVTEIGDFKVIDPLLEQFQEGKYDGRFWIREIYQHSYFAHGKLIVEIRARLADAQINDEAPLPKAGHKMPEGDPLDEAPVHTVTPVVRPSRQTSVRPVAPRQHTVNNPPVSAKQSTRPQTAPNSDRPNHVGADEGDAMLFGELYMRILARKPVKLDSTVERGQLRLQAQRIAELHYTFIPKHQVWYPNEAMPAPER
jgi:Protein of unknown function (DUF3275)